MARSVGLNKEKRGNFSFPRLSCHAISVFCGAPSASKGEKVLE